MAVTDQLRQIAALVAATSPLGNKQSGMRIEAGEWNRLVQTLLDILEIERLQETTTSLLLTERYATRDHEHLGEVEVTWLGPTLQERFGAGAGALSTRATLTELGKRTDTAATEVARLTGIVERQQERNDRASIDELDRKAKLRDFEDRFGGVENLRGLVSGLATTVSDLKPAIQTVLDLREELRGPDGNPIDVSGLPARIDAVRALAENLHGINGEPIRLRDVELRLTDLEAVTDTADGGLDGRLAALRAQIDTGVDGRVGDALDELRADVDQQLAATADGLRDEFGGRIDGRIDELVPGLINQQVPGMIDQRLKDFDLNSLVDKVVDRVKDELSAQMEEQLRAIREQLDAHEGTLKDLDRRVRRLEG